MEPRTGRDKGGDKEAAFSTPIEPPRSAPSRARSYRASRTPPRWCAWKPRWRSGGWRASTRCCSSPRRRGGGGLGRGAGARGRAREPPGPPSTAAPRAMRATAGSPPVPGRHSARAASSAAPSTPGATRGYTRRVRRDLTNPPLAPWDTAIPASITSRRGTNPNQTSRVHPRGSLTRMEMQLAHKVPRQTQTRSRARMPRASAAGSTSTSSSSSWSWRRIRARGSRAWRKRRSSRRVSKPRTRCCTRCCVSRRSTRTGRTARIAHTGTRGAGPRRAPGATCRDRPPTAEGKRRGWERRLDGAGGHPAGTRSSAARRRGCWDRRGRGRAGWGRACSVLGPSPGRRRRRRGFD